MATGGALGFMVSRIIRQTVLFNLRTLSQFVMLRECVQKNNPVRRPSIILVVIVKHFGGKTDIFGLFFSPSIKKMKKMKGLLCTS